MALAFAIESPLHAMLICPIVVSGVPSFTKMKFLFVTGDPVAVGEAVGVAVGVGVGLGEGGSLVGLVGMPDGEGVTEVDGVGVGVGVGDGERLGTTAPPTAWPARHT